MILKIIGAFFWIKKDETLFITSKEFADNKKKYSNNSNDDKNPDAHSCFENSAYNFTTRK